MMAVQLYTSRVVLNTLGVDDYGIYNVVGGVVAMFGFLNSAMTASTQRYITFEFGKGCLDRLKQVFFTSISIHLLISFVVVLLGETIGLWFVYEKLVIPEARMHAAMIVYQMSILSTVVAIMSYPFNADIVAHERMSAFAYISILEASLKLAIVYLLVVGDFDKLELYAYLITVVQVLICLCYMFYCRKNFEETKFKISFNKPLFKEMLGFAGWNLWGNLAAILFGQGLNILLNMFFGPAVNAARAVSVQVQGAIQQFSSNFQMALNPQITKSYALGKLNDMHKLVYRSSKFSFFLLFVLCLPVLFETEFILKIWLKNVPDNTVAFIRIMVITMMIDATSNPLMVSAQASGKIKLYQTVIGLILIAILPISYVVLKLGGAPWSVFVVHLIMCVIAFIARLAIIKPLICLDLKNYFKEVINVIIFVVLVAASLSALIKNCFNTGVISSLLVICISFAIAIFSCFFIGLNKHEKYVVISRISK